MSKKLIIGLTATAVIAGSIGWVTAAPRGSYGMGQKMGDCYGMKGPGGGRSGRAFRLKQADTNKDGVITREEMLTLRTTRFETLDVNKDGLVSEDEIFNSKSKHLKRRAKRQFRRQDLNRDGKVTKDEFLAKIDQRLYMLDLNDDGKITEDEMPPQRRKRRGWGGPRN